MLEQAVSCHTCLQELLVWGNVFGPASSRAFADTLANVELNQESQVCEYLHTI